MRVPGGRGIRSPVADRSERALTTVNELARALDRYLRHVAIERGLSANTVAAYRRDLTPFVEWLRVQAVTEPAQLTTDAVVAYARTLRDPSLQPGLAPASVARKLSSIRGFTRFLLEEGELEV